MGNIIYSKYSNDRSPQYMIATDIIEENSDRIVRKRAINPLAEKHVMMMKDYYKKLSHFFDGTRFVANTIVGEGKDYLDFEYVKGKGLEQCLDELLDAGEYDQMIDVIQSFFDELERIADKEYQSSDVFEHYFGNEELEGYSCISVGDVDLIFQNVIVNDKGQWNVIDYEWTVNCNIPVKYLEYRAIFLYIYGRSNRSKLIDKNLFEVFGITKHEEDTFARMEEHFQKVIKDGHMNLGDYYQYMGMPSINSQVMFEINARSYMEVYFDCGKGFNDNKKLFSDSNVKIILPNNLKALCIVPAPFDCLVQICDISDDRGNSIPYSADGVEMSENTYLFQADSKYIVIENIAKDVSYINVALEVSELTFEEKHDLLYLRSVNDSISWKITKPLRTAGDGARRLTVENKTAFVVKSGMKYLLHNGIRSTVRRTIELYGQSKNVLKEEDFRLSAEQINYQKNYEFDYKPFISVLVPLYNTPEKFLKEMIDSVVTQTYSNWELCLADGSDDEHSFVGDICKEYSDKDNRIVYKHLEENLGISDNTNACMKMATGDYIGLFDHDDLLTQDALFEVVIRLNEDRDIGALYTDEDKYLYDSRKKSGTYVQPHFKPDYNPDLLRSCNYICHFFVVKKSIADEVGGFRKEFDGSQDFDFIFRCVEKAGKVVHIPKILYHWRIHANSTAASPENKMYCYEAGRHAIEEHLKRNNIDAEVTITDNLGYYRVKYPLIDKPLVSIIIVNKDERKVLQKCIESVISKSTYKNYEIIVIDNNSEADDIKEYYNGIANAKNISVEYWDKEDNISQIINHGVKIAKGDYILLLDNHAEVISEDWIEEMLSNCLRNDVGIVGAKILYKNNTIRHCGKVIGLGGIAGNAYAGQDANYLGYSGRALAHQNLSAVSASCMMVSKKTYENVGGFEEKLPLEYNDVDFCLKTREAGKLIVMNPDVKLFYNGAKEEDEKISKQNNNHAKEVSYMLERWSDILEVGDPYYNKNLTLIRGDFSMKDKNEKPLTYI
mgnify:CR=1 FL=1